MAGPSLGLDTKDNGSSITVASASNCFGLLTPSVENLAAHTPNPSPHLADRHVTATMTSTTLRSDERARRLRDQGRTPVWQLALADHGAGGGRPARRPAVAGGGG